MYYFLNHSAQHATAQYNRSKCSVLGLLVGGITAVSSAWYLGGAIPLSMLLGVWLLGVW